MTRGPTTAICPRTPGRTPPNDGRRLPFAENLGSRSLGRGAIRRFAACASGNPSATARRNLCDGPANALRVLYLQFPARLAASAIRTQGGMHAGVASANRYRAGAENLIQQQAATIASRSTPHGEVLAATIVSAFDADARNPGRQVQNRRSGSGSRPWLWSGVNAHPVRQPALAIMRDTDLCRARTHSRVAVSVALQGSAVARLAPTT